MAAVVCLGQAPPLGSGFMTTVIRRCSPPRACYVLICQVGKDPLSIIVLHISSFLYFFLAFYIYSNFYFFLHLCLNFFLTTARQSCWRVSCRVRQSVAGICLRRCWCHWDGVATGVKSKWIPCASLVFSSLDIMMVACLQAAICLTGPFSRSAARESASA